MAPGAAGVFDVVATSAADPRRSAQATVTVRVKGKDKDKDKEAAVDKTVRIDKAVLAEKVSDVVVRPAVVSPVIASPAVIASPVILQRSFIAPAQRPEVGPLAAPSRQPPRRPDRQDQGQEQERWLIGRCSCSPMNGMSRRRPSSPAIARRARAC